MSYWIKESGLLHSVARDASGMKRNLGVIFHLLLVTDIQITFFLLGFQFKTTDSDPLPDLNPVIALAESMT